MKMEEKNRNKGDNHLIAALFVSYFTLLLPFTLLLLFVNNQASWCDITGETRMGWLKNYLLQVVIMNNLIAPSGYDEQFDCIKFFGW